MNHEAIQERLSSYLDGDLSAAERAEVEAHLEACAECREEYELLRVTVEALHDLPVLSAPAGFADALLEQIPDGAPAEDDEQDQGVVVPLRRKGPGALVWAPVAMAAAACLVVGVVWWQLPRLTGRGPGMDQSAPAVFAEAEEKAAEVPAAAAPAGRWGGDERAKVAQEPVADSATLDGLADGAEAAEDGERKRKLGRNEGTGGLVDLADPGTGALASGEHLGGSGARGTGATSSNQPAGSKAEAQRQPYYSDWERSGAAEASGGDAVADLALDGRGDDGFAPAPPAESQVFGGVAGEDGDDGVVDLSPPSTSSGASTRSVTEKADEFGFQRDGNTAANADDRDQRSRRESERLRKEEEAYRRLYDEGDATVDVAGAPLDEAEESELDFSAALEESPDAGYDEDEYDLDLEAADERSVSRSAGGGGRADKKAGPARDRESREESRRAKDKAATRGEPKAEDRDRSAFDDDIAQSAPVATEQVQTAGKAAAAGSAEWTLQTTDAGTPYAVSELCDEVFSLRCTWIAPGYRPRSLGGQDNYQVVELHLLGAEYATVQTRLRKLGSVLVRSEDIAMVEAADPVTVRLVIEYMP